MKSWRTIIKRLALLCLGLALLAGILAWWWWQRFNVTEIQAPSQLSADSWPAAQPSANDWPWWRGQFLHGEAQGPAPPIKWSTTENIKWKQRVPGRGHATPIIWGQQVFLYAADEPNQKLEMLSYDRSSGKEQWRAPLHQGGFPIKHSKNSHASSTPASDGKHVYSVAAVHDGIHVTATTLEGKIAWQTLAGPFFSENGYGSSPVLWGPYVIVAGDSSPLMLRRFSQSPSFLAALDRRTGQIAWRNRRPLGHSYGTPIVANLSGKDELLLAGGEAVVAYDPRNGQELWRYPWPSSRTLNTIAVSGDRLIATSSLPMRLSVCLQGDGHLLWKSDRYTCDVPTPLFRAERLYLVEDAGIVTCLNSQDGQLLWKGRLGSGTSVSASPVIHGKHIYAAAENGKTYVFEDGPAFKLLATNDLGEEQLATPAIAGGDIFIRTSDHLWCISQQKAESKP